MKNAKNKRITVRMNTHELTRLNYAAKLGGKSLEQFVLDVAIEEANRVLEVPQNSESFSNHYKWNSATP